MCASMGALEYPAQDDRFCTLLMIGAQPDGQKELLAPRMATGKTRAVG